MATKASCSMVTLVGLPVIGSETVTRAGCEARRSSNAAKRLRRSGKAALQVASAAQASKSRSSDRWASRATKSGAGGRWALGGKVGGLRRRKGPPPVKKAAGKGRASLAQVDEAARV